MFGKKNEKLEVLKGMLGSRAAYLETVEMLELDKREKDIFLRASLEVKKKKPNLDIIDQAHAILIGKSFKGEEENSKNNINTHENELNKNKKKSKGFDNVKDNDSNSSRLGKHTSNIEDKTTNNINYEALNYKPQKKSYLKYLIIAILVIFVFNLMNNNTSNIGSNPIESKIQEHGYNKVSYSSKTSVTADVFKENVEIKEDVKTKRVNFNNVYKENGICFTKSTRQPFTGVVEYSIGNGPVGQEESFKNGKKHGTSIVWYVNGRKESLSTYKNGKRDGKDISWYENGRKSEEINYKNDLVDGKYTAWFSNGYREQESFYKNGKLHGRSVGWEKDGTKSYENFYKNGKLDGVTFVWCCGKRVYKILYENGVQVNKTSL